MTLILEPETAMAHAWWWPVGDGSVDPADLALLSPGERARADRFRVARAAVVWVTARAAIRRILSGLLDVPPEQIDLGRRPCPGCGDPEHGPPAVLHPETPWWISLSHTDGCGMLAVARGPVGVDVEGIREYAVDELAPATLTDAERSAVYEAGEGTPRTEVFLRCWTRKEAVLKAVGVGITTDLTGVDTHPEQLDGAVVRTGVPGTPSTWWVTDVEVPGPWVAALAVQTDDGDAEPGGRARVDGRAQGDGRPQGGGRVEIGLHRHLG